MIYSGEMWEEVAAQGSAWLFGGARDGCQPPLTRFEMAAQAQERRAELRQLRANARAARAAELDRERQRRARAVLAAQEQEAIELAQLRARSFHAAKRDAKIYKIVDRVNARRLKIGVAELDRGAHFKRLRDYYHDQEQRDRAYRTYRAPELSIGPVEAFTAYLEDQAAALGRRYRTLDEAR
jgi:hypothetical protein